MEIPWFSLDSLRRFEPFQGVMATPCEKLFLAPLFLLARRSFSPRSQQTGNHRSVLLARNCRFFRKWRWETGARLSPMRPSVGERERVARARQPVHPTPRVWARACGACYILDPRDDRLSGSGADVDRPNIATASFIRPGASLAPLGPSALNCAPGFLDQIRLSWTSADEPTRAPPCVAFVVIRVTA